MTLTNPQLDKYQTWYEFVYKSKLLDSLGGIESTGVIFTDTEEEKERRRDREREMNGGSITPHVVNLKSRQGSINHLNP